MAGGRGSAGAGTTTFGTMLQIELQTSPKGTVFDFTSGSYLRTGSDRFQAALQAIVGAGGHRMANAAAKKMKEALDEYNVTASGGAKNAIGTYQVGANDAGEIWGVVEDGSTIANQMIRYGIQPQAKMPPLSRIKQWADRKGVTITYQGKAGSGLIASRSKSGKGYVRARKGTRSQDPEFKGLFALARAIQRGGSFRPTSDWRTYTPGGEGYFDYVTHVVERMYDDQFQTIVNHMGTAVGEAVVRYLSTGQAGASRSVLNQGGF